MLLFGGFLPGVDCCKAAEAPPAEGGMLPSISLPIPDQASEREYLGLGAGGVFKIPEVRADLIIIEVFSMYCPFCQKEAPNVNELFRLIENNSQWKNRIKIIGIGAGNSPFEVGVFRKTYSVPFPLFPDNDFSCYEALGKARTPFFIVIKLEKHGSHKIIYSKGGGFGDPKDFLELLLKQSGLQKGT
jgi:thiol-disulfide isomerase/thioredoxin